MTPLVRCFIACWVLILGGLASAQPSFQPFAAVRRIDPDSGRGLANWPHPRHFDHQHMRLELNLVSLDPPVFQARETLRMSPIGQPRSRIMLDAVDLDIESVGVRRASDHRSRLRRFQGVSYTYDGQDLVIDLDIPADLGETIEVTIDYRITNFLPEGQGLSIAPGHPDAENDSDRWPVISSQGQSEHNSKWFACHDFPNERLSTELIVTVDDPLQAVSNGSLIERRKLPGGRTRFHWLQSQPHVNYLVTLVIGVFERVELGGPESARPGLPIGVWAPIGRGEHVRASFDETPAMIAYFERLFDEPYPWDKYDQVITRGFDWGAMENTSATTFYPAAAYQSREELRSIVAHELAHQWFGDLVTCKGWDHLWLNEGWASYAEALWNEEMAGEDPAARRSAYLATVAQWADSQRGSNFGGSPEQAPLVSNFYPNADEPFMKVDNPYTKGPWVLHMLRTGLGDEAFFAGTRLYLDRMRFDQAETADFRRALEEVSGRSLERFFEQWCHRPGIARLDVGFESDGSNLSVEVMQTQRIDGLNPAYHFVLPMYVQFTDGTGQYVYLSVEGQTTRQTFRLGRPAVGVRLDPNMTVAAGHNIVRSLQPAGGAESSAGTNQ